jgi:hypothetical protein
MHSSRNERNSANSCAFKGIVRLVGHSGRLSEGPSVRWRTNETQAAGRAGSASHGTANSRRVFCRDRSQFVGLSNDYRPAAPNLALDQAGDDGGATAVVSQRRKATQWSRRSFRTFRPHVPRAVIRSATWSLRSVREPKATARAVQMAGHGSSRSLVQAWTASGDASATARRVGVQKQVPAS